MTVASKNGVVVGFVAYFVGLSLMGLMIYRWSQPRSEAPSAAAKAAPHAAPSAAVVEYEALAGQEILEPETVASGPSKVDEAAPSETAAPAPAPQDEWN